MEQTVIQARCHGAEMESIDYSELGRMFEEPESLEDDLFWQRWQETLAKRKRGKSKVLDQWLERNKK